MLTTIANQSLEVRIDDVGAEMRAITDTQGTEYLWQRDPAYWKGSAPNLFPYIGRLYKEQYRVYGKTYRLGIHGFVKNETFDVQKLGADAAVFSFSSTDSTQEQYPFSFRYQIIYRLDGASLHITYLVVNCCERTMFFGIGGHPGFRVPIVNGLTFSDYRLRFHAPCSPLRVVASPALLDTRQRAPYPLLQGTVLPLTHALFDNDAVILTQAADSVTLESALDPHSVTLHYPSMRYLGIWHMPHTDAPYVCIEPWSSCFGADAAVTDLAEQADLVALDPASTYQNDWSITICGA